MRTSFRGSFGRDLKKIRDRRILDRVKDAILGVENADGHHEIVAIKKIAGDDHSFRIRIGEYRIGLLIDGDRAEFVRCLHRRDMYRFFP